MTHAQKPIGAITVRSDRRRGNGQISEDAVLVRGARDKYCASLIALHSTPDLRSAGGTAKLWCRDTLGRRMIYPVLGPVEQLYAYVCDVYEPLVTSFTALWSMP